MAKQHHSRRPVSHGHPTKRPAFLPQQHPISVKDEFKEREERQRAQRLREIAMQHLELAHERTIAASAAGHYEQADNYSMSVMAWCDRVEELG